MNFDQEFREFISQKERRCRHCSEIVDNDLDGMRSHAFIHDVLASGAPALWVEGQFESI